MTERRTAGELAEAVQEAVLGTPGVACLRPGIADLLRVSTSLTRRSSAVRVTRDKGAAAWHAEIHVVLRRGHRSVDVTREVRAAVTEALLRLTGESRPPRVTVTVTGRV
ncbi:Asp23/Gls24 family envelope stress response protein [Streptomyces sp. NPDC029674]|uniref:Asp23/Gls24 family envelope stress response protein n=1 Tax=Streptomyces sp. NPDC029674 TaxID=3365297 RepID=UPI00384D9C7D